LFKKLNIKGIMLTESESKLGGVETFKEANVAQIYLKNMLLKLPAYWYCYQLWRRKRSGRNIKTGQPQCSVLIQAYPDELSKMDVVNRGIAGAEKYLYAITYTNTV
jgi:hypothetical protein